MYFICSLIFFTTIECSVVCHFVKSDFEFFNIFFSTKWFSVMRYRFIQIILCTFSGQKYSCLIKSIIMKMYGIGFLILLF